MIVFNKWFLILVVIFIVLNINNCKVKNESPVDKYNLGNSDKLGMDSEILAEGFQKADDSGFVFSIIIEKGGALAGEYYFDGYTEKSFFNIKSVSKSILSALVGIAFNKGFILDLDQKIIDILPEYKEFITDIRFNNITIRHLLTMRGGFDGDRNIFSKIFDSSNPLKAIFSESLIYEPGTSMVYSTPQTHLLACSLARLINSDLKEFADQYLFNPLGISVDLWEKDPQGNYIGGNNMFFQTKELALFGNLYVNNGKFNNIQIIPEYWVKNSLKNSLENADSSWGALHSIGYGNLWWLGIISGYDIFTAIGYGGQFVLYIPELELLIITNSISDLGWDTADSHERFILDIIRDYIIPSCI